VELTVLGCCSGMPAGGEASSGYLVSGAGTDVLLDCGPGIATALGALGGPARLGAVVVSHLHLDHCYDLLPLGKSLLTMGMDYPGAPPRAVGPIDPLPLYVPRGCGDLLRRWAGLFPVPTLPQLDRAFDVAFDVREYRPGDTLQVGALELELHELRHGAPNCGTRLSDGVSTVAYTGDTGTTPALVDLARDVDLLVAEASLAETDTGPQGHLSGADAGRAATAAAAASLLLTHWTSEDPLWRAARRADARAVYGGPVHGAHAGWTSEVGADAVVPAVG
jgi:ribonuclease BN (tRNA processing enzyme)